MLKRLAALIVLALAAGSSAAADTYPSRPVVLVIPFPPGGVTDLVGRMLAAKLSIELGQKFVAENKAGASGILGTGAAAKSSADGYTLLLGNISTLAVNSATFATLPYDPVTSFAPVSMLALQPLLIAVHPSVPAKDIAELIKLAKAKPGGLSFGTAGSSIQLAVELFSSLTQIKMNHVPYKGSAPAITDLVGGHIEVLFDPISTIAPMVHAGKARGLAVTTEKRSATTPDLPTVIESGVPGYDVSSWQALMVPAGTPNEIVERLHQATVKVLALPDVKEFLAKQGAQAAPSTPQQLQQYIASEITRWKKVAQEAGVKPE